MVLLMLFYNARERERGGGERGECLSSVHKNHAPLSHPTDPIVYPPTSNSHCQYISLRLPIHPIDLERPFLYDRLFVVTEHQFQVLALPHLVGHGKDPGRKPEDLGVGDAGRRVPEQQVRRGIHGQGGHFADGIPTARRNTCGPVSV